MFGLDPIIIGIIGVTALVSYRAFNDKELTYKLIFFPFKIATQKKEYSRFLTSGFIHADQQHLFFNMLTLFFFGPFVLSGFKFYGIEMAELKFMMLYLFCIAFSSVSSFIKHQNNPNYMALGASGGVSGIVFAAIIMEPWLRINFIIPGFIYGIGYLWYSARMAKLGRDNIGHDAHIHGALIGAAITLLYKPSLALEFIEKIMAGPGYF